MKNSLSAGVAILIYLILNVRDSSGSFFWNCKTQGQIFPGKNDGVVCNTYHQCFKNINEKHSWTVKTFTCPAGGIWDREYEACVEDNTCPVGGINECDGESTNRPDTPTPTPTDGPPPFTSSTRKPGTSTCGRQLDVECKDDPLAHSQGWKGSPETNLQLYDFPNFHGFKATEPFEKNPDGSSIIFNQNVMPQGNLHGFLECPNGTYIMSYAAAWVGNLKAGERSAVNTVFLCQTPSFTGRHLLNSNLDGYRSYAVNEDWQACQGVVVGFRVNTYPSGAVHLIEIKCSTDAPRRRLPFNFRSLTKVSSKEEFVYCAKYQAACGMQSRYADGSGLTNLRMKCCFVEHPWKDCVFTEGRIKIRDCDNFGGPAGLRCRFRSRVGISVNNTDQQQMNQLIFYSSIGYDLDSWQGYLKTKSPQLATNKSMEYDWANVDCRMEEEESTSAAVICVKPFERVDIYQIVGRCGYLVVRTNRYVKVVKNAEGETVSEEYIDI